jgi:hypothetical protein
MNTSKSLGVLAVLREATDLLSSLDQPGLPPLCAVSVGHDFTADALSARAQLSAHFPTELDAIDAIRTWALALGGVVLLGDENPGFNRPYRELTACLPLPSGGLFEVWDMLHDLHSAPVPADLVG